MSGTDAINLAINIVRVATHFPIYTATVVLYQAAHPFEYYRPFFQQALFVCVNISIDTAMTISQSVQT